ncbi:MAG: GYD domain-containing protein [Nitrososphaeraceae archaeon]
MSFYITLWTFSHQGIEKIKDSPKRADHFKQVAESKGVKVHDIYYTFGQYDGVGIVEAPDDATLMSALLSVESEGNARTVTLKAFKYEEAKKIIDNL